MKRDAKCPYCGFKRSLLFPCCGYYCLNCGKSFEEEESNMPEEKGEINGST